MTDAPSHILFALGQIATCRRALSWQHAHALNLNPTQSEILLYLARRGPSRSAAVAEALGVSGASLTDSVHALVAKQLLRRQPDPADQRAHRLDLTEDGRNLADRLRDAPNALSAAVAELPPGEQGQMLRLLTGLIRGLQERQAIPAQRMCVSCRYFRPHVHEDAARPHHCSFVNAAFGDASLRLDCGEHEAAQPDESAANWQRFKAA